MTQESFVDTNPEYWDEYTNLQRVKLPFRGKHVDQNVVAVTHCYR